MTCDVIFTEKIHPQQTGETGRPEHITTVKLNLINRCKMCKLEGITKNEVEMTTYEPTRNQFVLTWKDF